MTEQSLEAFKALGWQAYSIRQLRTRTDDDANDFWNVFFEAYMNAPLRDMDSFNSRLFGFEYLFRGAVWELFLWSQFSRSINLIEIERPIGDSLKSADFAWEYAGKSILLEATTKKRSNLEIRTSAAESQLMAAVDSILHRLNHTIHITTLMGSEDELKIGEILLHLECFHKDISAEDSDSSKPQITRWKDSESDWNLEIEFIRHSEIHEELTPISVVLSPFEIRPATEPRGMAEILRGSLRDKLDKFDSIEDECCVIAIAHELDALGESRIDQYATLIGRWSQKWNLESAESSLELTDHGFFLTDQGHTKKISAVMFGYGYMPGFSSVIKPILWLNPMAINHLDPLGFPLDVVVARVESDGTLMIKESNLDSSIWETVALF